MTDGSKRGEGAKLPIGIVITNHYDSSYMKAIQELLYYKHIASENMRIIDAQLRERDAVNNK